MKKTILLLLALLLPALARASYMSGAFTNATTGGADTNYFLLYQLDTTVPVLADGTIQTISRPTRIYPAADGRWTNQIGIGNWFITKSFLGKGYAFRSVNDAGSNIYNISSYPISALNTFVTIVVTNAGSNGTITLNQITNATGHALLSPSEITNAAAGMTNAFGSAAYSAATAFDTNGAALAAAQLATNGIKSSAYHATNEFDLAGTATTAASAATNSATIVRSSQVLLTTNVVTALVVSGPGSVSFSTNASGISATVAINPQTNGFGNIVSSNAADFDLAGAAQKSTNILGSASRFDATHFIATNQTLVDASATGINTNAYVFTGTGVSGISTNGKIVTVTISGGSGTNVVSPVAAGSRVSIAMSGATNIISADSQTNGFGTATLHAATDFDSAGAASLVSVAMIASNAVQQANLSTATNTIGLASSSGLTAATAALIASNLVQAANDLGSSNVVRAAMVASNTTAIASQNASNAVQAANIITTSNALVVIVGNSTNNPTIVRLGDYLAGSNVLAAANLSTSNGLAGGLTPQQNNAVGAIIGASSLSTPMQGQVLVMILSASNGAAAYSYALSIANSNAIVRTNTIIFSALGDTNTALRQFVAAGTTNPVFNGVIYAGGHAVYQTGSADLLSCLNNSAGWDGTYQRLNANTFSNCIGGSPFAFTTNGAGCSAISNGVAWCSRAGGFDGTNWANIGAFIGAGPTMITAFGETNFSSGTLSRGDKVIQGNVIASGYYYGDGRNLSNVKVLTSTFATNWSGAVDITAYGAIPDGSNDCTASLIAAQSSGRPVYFPPGPGGTNNFVLSQITLTNSQCMIGDQTRITFNAASNGTFIKVCTGAKLVGFDIYGANTFAITNIGTNRIGVHLDPFGTNTVFKDSFIHDFDNTGLMIRSPGSALNGLDRGYAVCTGIRVRACGLGVNVPTFVYTPFGTAGYLRLIDIMASDCFQGLEETAGNVTIIACDFSRNTNNAVFEYNPPGNTGQNPAHGPVVACNFNHPNGGTGLAINGLIEDGETFQNCMFYFSSISITNSRGVDISGGQMGDGTAITFVGCTNNYRNEVHDFWTISADPTVTKTTSTNCFVYGVRHFDGSPSALPGFTTESDIITRGGRFVGNGAGMSNSFSPIALSPQAATPLASASIASGGVYYSDGVAVSYWGAAYIDANTAGSFFYDTIPQTTNYTWFAWSASVIGGAGVSNLTVALQCQARIYRTNNVPVTINNTVTVLNVASNYPVVVSGTNCFATSTAQCGRQLQFNCTPTNRLYFTKFEIIPLP